MSFLEDFRYDRPRTYRIMLGSSALLAVTLLLAAIPDSAATEAMGLVALRERAEALRHAAYWQARAMVNTPSALIPTVEYGFVLGIDADKRVVVSVPVGDRFVTRKLHLADVVVTDLEGAGGLIGRYKQTNSRIDVYDDMAVVWIEDKPLNIQLIEEGMATPQADPPTNIVDRAFTAYYWNLAKRGPEN